MASNIKQDNLTLPFGGISVRGQLTTNLDNGKVQWRPYNGLFVRQDVYLESTYDQNTKTWKWTPVGDVFGDVRSFNPSVAAQYSTTNSVAQEFYTNTYRSVDQTINTNWTKYEVPVTAQRNNWVRGSGNVPQGQGSGTGSPDGAGAPPPGGGSEDPPVQPILPPTNDINYNILGSDESIAIDNKIKTIFASGIRYPEKTNPDQDNIKFTAKSIKTRLGINISQVSAFNLGTNAYDTLGHVILPIQPSISDSNGVDWGGTSLNPIQAYAASASLQMIDSPGGITGGAAEALRNAAIAFKTGLGQGFGEAISLYFAQEAVGAQNLLSRTTGSVLNPNLELLFNGPTLRNFNFTFRLSPRSQGEARIVKQIIWFFKASMSVKVAKSQVFLKAPNVFDIQYLSGSEIHKSLNKIKTCALLGCDVDYTPDGTYMTFNDEGKTMTSYQLTLRFSELDPVYNDDYSDDTSIGY